MHKKHITKSAPAPQYVIADTLSSPGDITLELPLKPDRRPVVGYTMGIGLSGWMEEIPIYATTKRRLGRAPTAKQKDLLRVLLDNPDGATKQHIMSANGWSSFDAHLVSQRPGPRRTPGLRQLGYDIPAIDGVYTLTDADRERAAADLQ